MNALSHSANAALSSASEAFEAIDAVHAAAGRALVVSAKVLAAVEAGATAAIQPGGSMRDDDDPAADFEAQKQWSPYTAIYNITGQPSISVPLNWTDEGLPIGVQFAGRRDREDVLIELAAQLEEASPWHHRRPTIW